MTDLLERIQALPKGADAGPGSYSHCRTLQELGYCLRDAGQFEAAEGRFREALALLEVLLKEQPEQREMRIQHAALLNNMGTVLLRQGQYTQAQACYEQALGEQRAINDAYNEAGTLENLGALALVQGDYAQAHSRYLQALQQSQAMGDPRQQALAWYQLGIVAEKQGAWKEAERRYRESLTLEERIGDTARAAATCNQLALVAKNSGRPTEAEGWYKGALERIERVESGGINHARYLNNLANLLVNEVRAGRADSSRLAEARHFVEQARHIKEQPGVSAEVWAIYSLLAQIAEMEGQPEVARDYHRHEREAYAAFAGNRYRIDQRHAPLIRDIVAATRGDAQARAKVTAALPAFEENGYHISEGVQRIWQGEREWQVLAEGLDGPDSLLLLRVLETLAAPEAPSLEERPTVEDLLAALPPSILAAIEQEDQVACQQALMALAPEEQQRVVAALQVLQRQIKRDELEQGK